MGIFTRTSIREFTEEKLNREQLDMIFKAAMQAPSAVNQQPWEFLVIDDKSVISKFVPRGPFARPLVTAPTLIILYYRNNVSHPQFVLEDMSACMENALLEIDDLGLGGVWMGVAPVPEKIAMVNEIAGEMKGLTPFGMIAVGYPKDKKSQTSRYDATRVHFYNK